MVCIVCDVKCLSHPPPPTAGTCLVVESHIYDAGPIAICRFLARQCNLYPTNPGDALSVDASIEVLERHLHCLDSSQPQEVVVAHIQSCIQEIEPRVRQTLRNEFERLTVADILWMVTFEYVVATTDLDPVALIDPESHLCQWWTLNDISFQFRSDPS